MLFIPVVIWMGFIAFLSLMKQSNLPENIFLQRIYADKWIHVILYAVLSFLVVQALSRNFIESSKIFFYAAFVSIIYGILMEAAQSKMNLGRSFELLDILANITGSFSGVLIYKRKNRI